MRESKMWFLHLLAGAVIFILLAVHMAIMLLNDIFLMFGVGYSDPIAYESVLARSKQLLLVVTNILLLGAALYHGLYGSRNILFELTLNEGLERFITVIFVLFGIGLFIFGTYAAIATYMIPN